MNIQKISLRDIVFSGLHGATDVELEIAQRFQVDITITFNALPSIHSEKLEDTIDYFDIIKCVRSHIENNYRKHILLETLVNEITDDIARKFLCHSIQLSIQKLDVPFKPQIGTAKHYFTGASFPTCSFEYVHQQLITQGAVSIPFLTHEERGRLVDEAKKLEYITQPEQAFGGIVREEVASCSVKDEGTQFFSVADKIARFVTELYTVTHQGFPQFPKPHVALQKYNAGSIGITPHRDEKKYGMVIAIIPLVGKGDLSICDDRAGNNPKKQDTSPGNLILLRAPGYAGMHVRPMHVVNNITEERIVIGVRFPTNE